MARYVDIDKLITEYDRVHIGEAGGARKLMIDAPTADVQEVKHGEWNVDYDCESVVLSCSLCDEKYWIEREDELEKHKPNYCPRCGAKMDKE